MEYAGKASVALSASERVSWLSSPAAANWNTDTGATSHMTPHRRWFRSYSPHIVPVRLANNQVIYSAGMGSVVFEPLIRGSTAPAVVFHDVLHVPQLGSNLLSVYHLTRAKGYRCEIQDATASFYLSGKLLFTASVNDRNTGYLDGRTLVPSSQSASIADACPLDLSLWHRRCSHLNHDDLLLMKRKELVTGLSIRSSIAPDPICEPCIARKQHRHNVPQHATRPSAALDLVVSDLKGPLPVASIEGYKYWITFIDAHTRLFVVSFLRKKSDAFEAFKAYKAYAENALGTKIKCTLDDKGGEYVSKEWDAFCVQEGIVRKHTETDEPHQNGISERANQTIQAAVTAMLTEAKLPASFWTYAVRCFVHVHNRLPTSSLSGAIPYSLWKKGKKPDLSYFRSLARLLMS